MVEHTSQGLLPLSWILNMLDAQLFLTKTAGQLISGYEDQLMALAGLDNTKFGLTNNVKLTYFT